MSLTNREKFFKIGIAVPLFSGQLPAVRQEFVKTFGGVGLDAL
ncbi:MAG: hypothetical protein WC335_05050 [Candidatus Omnitrophota bacterium]